MLESKVGGASSVAVLCILFSSLAATELSADWDYSVDLGGGTAPFPVSAIGSLGFGQGSYVWTLAGGDRSYSYRARGLFFYLNFSWIGARALGQ